MPDFANSYGAWVLAALLTIECSGIPVPGETTLIAWSLYAGTFHPGNIWLFIASAICGAIAGNIVGYLLGRSIGYRVLVRHGYRMGLTEGRVKIGQYLFRHYGIAAVIIGRFLPFFRSALPLLAGANRMAFWPFLLATILGGVAWVTSVGLAAFYFGVALIHLSATAMILAGLGIAIVALLVVFFIRRHEATLMVLAEREFPGPLSNDVSPRRQYSSIGR
jgi:membrane protein DedA with SNARE-associated domain